MWRRQPTEPPSAFYWQCRSFPWQHPHHLPLSSAGRRHHLSITAHHLTTTHALFISYANQLTKTTNWLVSSRLLPSRCKVGWGSASEGHKRHVVYTLTKRTLRYVIFVEIILIGWSWLNEMNDAFATNIREWTDQSKQICIAACVASESETHTGRH